MQGGDALLFVAKFDFGIYEEARHGISMERNGESMPDHAQEFVGTAYSISCMCMFLQTHLQLNWNPTSYY